MAESDAAGPVPRRKRPLGILDIAREAERSFAPLRAAIEQAERACAPMRKAAETAAQFHQQMLTGPAATLREIFGDSEEDPEPAPPAKPPLAALPASKPTPPPRPPFEINPPAHLLAALRQAFRGFKPTDGWWFHVEKVLKDAHHRSNAAGHAAFCAAYAGWSTEDLLRHLESEGLSKKPPRQRGETTCERLRDLYEKDPEFAETASLRRVGKRIGRSTGAIDSSHYYQTKLKPIREEIAAEKARVKAARRFGHFDSVGRRDESTEGL